MVTPLLVIGDSPRRATGLARIARDLTTRLLHDRTLDLAVAQAGPDDGQGVAWTRWPFYGLPTDDQQWGASRLAETWASAFGDVPGVVLTIWDPARSFHLLQARRGLPAETQWWGYFPVDARTRRGPFGGPAAVAVRAYDRALGYGRWGADVLKAVTGSSVEYLPHGLEEGWAVRDGDALATVRHLLGRRVTDETVLIGCVAANQPRKDLGVFAETLAVLRDRGLRVHGWLHTDVEIGTRETQWVVPQLAEEYGLGRMLTVTTELTDAQLAAFYQTCTVTVAPGLGEGFGYPIVESLAAGTPAVHATYGGGAELVPKAEWRVPVRADRVEGPYALVRPVYQAEDFANAIERAIAWRRSEVDGGRAYCQGAVAHLQWGALWPRWASWVRTGLREM